MIVAELALLTERHGEASKEVKMPHQYSGRFFVKRENKNQNHQHSNLHHLYIAEILTKLQVIYDTMVWKVITTRFRNWISSIYIQEGKEREVIGDRRDTAFLECPIGLYATLRDRFFGQTATIYVQEGKKREVTGDLCALPTVRDRSIHDAITQQSQSIYDATVRRSIPPGFRNQTQKSRFIYDAMVWVLISMSDGITPHLMVSMTGQHRGRCFIYDAMS